MTIKWEGKRGVVWTENQAEGALPNGSRVEKVNSERADGHRDGALGTVIGSIAVPETPGLTDRYVYFVAWDEDPAAGIPVGIRAGRVRAKEGDR